jgi:hypothetical protein
MVNSNWLWNTEWCKKSLQILTGRFWLLMEAGRQWHFHILFNCCVLIFNVNMNTYQRSTPLLVYHIK